MSIFIPTYFAPISQYSEIVKSTKVVFEMEDNFQKQGFRNRCYIYNGNGKQLLTVPVKHALKEGRKKTKDVLVENNFPWQDQHFKSLKIAYRSSPFFEFYVDEIAHIFEKEYKYLQDLNTDSHLFIANALQIETSFTKTNEYLSATNKTDFRALAEIKNQPEKLVAPYIQMFDDKHGFIPNLSILDLLFMEGPNAISYL